MAYRVAADAVLLLHLAFVLFVAGGGLLVLWRRRIAWLHLPALAWGAYVEFSGRICPLTPLENRLRRLAGGSGYEGGFTEHYLLPLLYPAGLTPDIQTGLGVAALLVNAAVYAWLLTRRT